MADSPVIPSVPGQVVPTSAPTKAPVAPVDAKATAPVNAKATEALKPTTPAEKEVIRKIKLGDTEYDETTLANLVEKSKGADKTFRDSSNMRKEAMRLFKMAKENPRDFLEKTGVDVRQLSYDEVAKDIQDKLRDPRDIELDKIRKENETFKAKETAEKERIQAEKLDRQSKALEERFHAEAIAALEAHPSIPKNGFSVAKMAKYIEVVQQKTGERLSFEDVAGVIENDIRSEISGMVKGASAEQLIELIGQEGIEAIRQYHLLKLKDPLAGNSGTSGTSAPKPAAPRAKNSKEVWKAIDEAAAREGYNRFGQKVR